mmetsp:Transcript_23133/g.57531  ORF Transcript_23133/g.57531 Transcript_23133/m.57531 type:complete len:206 (+) Transcript_23133:1215-1832(+)
MRHVHHVRPARLQPCSQLPWKGSTRPLLHALSLQVLSSAPARHRSRQRGHLAHPATWTLCSQHMMIGSTMRQVRSPSTCWLRGRTQRLLSKARGGWLRRSRSRPGSLLLSPSTAKYPRHAHGHAHWLLKHPARAWRPGEQPLALLRHPPTSASGCPAPPPSTTSPSVHKSKTYHPPLALTMPPQPTRPVLHTRHSTLAPCSPSPH